MRVEICVTAGPAKGQRFTFDKPDYFLFGRAPDAHISLPTDHYISRQHFSLHVAPPTCKLRDLGSTNGVLVNGVRYGGKTPPVPPTQQAPVNEVALKDGDEIVVGETHINVSIIPIQNNRTPAGQPEEAQQQEQIAPPREVALLVIDLVHSTQHLLKMGDHRFGELIEQIRQRFYTHRSAPALLSLKCTGDGFLATFRTVTKALFMATDFLKTPVHVGVHIRMSLHWGAVKTSPDGNVLGKEAQHVRKLDGLQEKDRLKTEAAAESLPEYDRILVTKSAFKRLKPSNRRKFTFAGTFSVGEYVQEPCALWFFTNQAAEGLSK